MIEIEIRDINNNIVGKKEVPDIVFNNSASESVVHTAVVAYMANQRQGTHCTKTRSEVSGGGKKPWRQKHTGRARHGSIRSPLWRKGGIVFGPKPRDYYIQLPKQMKDTALFKALTMKYRDNEILLLDNLSLNRIKTKDMVEILKNLQLEESSVLIALPEKDEKVLLSARNIPYIGVVRAEDLNAYHVAMFDKVVFTVAGLDKLLSIKGVS
ncbi:MULTISPECIES: 50S ribosomal protein L4 [Thermodesulfovibrio]|uniref:Large ribosomal subunit protein uL4 n=2 Tax=Thermodesulfovibrio yellowstonii TaxID=28262 RepID=RL4_THEYD|nr:MULTISPECIES: 50S ribosomal protein L4 [Thermodesulfovibrio]B5YG46.1 RecName: Full=Large ribosomal subunit protein uL4; AltName: Full=50S ribosomal protein L4 [Thermodesulfovibrio yellowstonii DSM 11347]ACI22114.1 ribosomal protein L4/L1 family [Thermodesulfovibrio yellowstonii DSM 11347]MDI6865923.1 50S ribosomal protein L4 [Thermodesulfovibrio yellowstonii]GLI53165.1 50S ribosomal protein L4 [Thermodesulfovibrio islandicus]